MSARKRKGHDAAWAGWITGVSHYRCAACGKGYSKWPNTIGYRLAHERSHPTTAVQS